MASGGFRGRGRRWLVGAVVLLLAVPLSAGVLANRSHGPWGARAEEWSALFLLVHRSASSYHGPPAAFYASGAELDLRPQSGLVLDPPAALRPTGGGNRPATMINEVEQQGVFVGDDGVLLFLAGPLRHPFIDGPVVAPLGSATSQPQEVPRHFAVLLELGQEGITRQTDLADLDTWGTAPRRCKDAAAEQVLERYVRVWSGSGGARGVYAEGAAVVDGATGRRAEGPEAIGAWAGELAGARGAPRLQPLRGAAGRAWYVTCDPLAAPDRMVLVLQRADRRGCPIDYAADLRLDESGRVVAEEWLTSPASARRCLAGEELEHGVWGEVSIPSPVSGPDTGTLERPEQVITLVNATPPLVEQLDWALRRYQEAGLRAPLVRSVTWVDRRDGACRVVNGLAMSTATDGFAVTLCFDHGDACSGGFDCPTTKPWTRVVLLHELAHVWLAQNADAGVEVDYLRHARLKHWARAETPYQLRGVERACWDIAYGLMDEPRDEQPDGTEACGWYDDGFRLLTGVDPLTPACA
ncbi:MAG TPA: hypothetical protein VK908_10400 [Jiangellales bacterium]|nr:hypothetical protein [Jiangellales bacterium]